MKNSVVTDCDKISMDEFIKSLKLIVKEIREFNTGLLKFVENQKKQSRELWMLVVRYGVLDKCVYNIVIMNIIHPFYSRAARCVYPILEKEEIMTELMMSIQEKSTTIEVDL